MVAIRATTIRAMITGMFWGIWFLMTSTTIQRRMTPSNTPKNTWILAPVSSCCVASLKRTASLISNDCIWMLLFVLGDENGKIIIMILILNVIASSWRLGSRNDT